MRAGGVDRPARNRPVPDQRSAEGPNHAAYGCVSGKIIIKGGKYCPTTVLFTAAGIEIHPSMIILLDSDQVVWFGCLGQAQDYRRQRHPGRWSVPVSSVSELTFDRCLEGASS
jgi:hypothetical protein